MAQKPDGKAAKTERVVFTRPAAERISKVVRTVEAGSRGSAGLSFGRAGDSSGGVPKAVRAATFTGSWAINASKVVTFKYAPTATASVLNLLINLPSAGQRNCIVGREGTSWNLVNWQWDIAHAATAATLTTTSLRFDTLPVGALATSSTVTFSVSVATCSTT
jgi:hypothetical protein